ncbi:hypothetical protein L1887_32025 [Cichorium endivia]|nr:hypothetical protein L1887_32025 [Cichorium endivia]
MVVKVLFLAASPTRGDRGCSVVVRLMVTMAVTTGDDGDAHEWDTSEIISSVGQTETEKLKQKSLLKQKLKLKQKSIFKVKEIKGNEYSRAWSLHGRISKPLASASAWPEKSYLQGSRILVPDSESGRDVLLGHERTRILKETVTLFP